MLFLAFISVRHWVVGWAKGILACVYCLTTFINFEIIDLLFVQHESRWRYMSFNLV